jgi:hypothetical protein
LKVNCAEGFHGHEDGEESEANGRQALLDWPQPGRASAQGVPLRGRPCAYNPHGAGILLEPVPVVKKETFEELFARMDAMDADPILPEGRQQNLAPIREYFK